MNWRVNLTDWAVEDLRRLDRTMLVRVVKKLLQLEQAGPELGRPLGRRNDNRLTGFRKLTVGNRDLRIIYRERGTDLVLDVLVIGERSDEWCYREAARRIEQLGDGHPAAQPLQELLATLAQVRGLRPPDPP